MHNIFLNNSAGQSSSGGINVGALIAAGVIILIIACACLPLCILCLTVAICCTCVKNRKAKKASAQPAAAEMVTQESKSSIHNLPLPPIPNDLYEEIVVTESNVEGEESKASAKQLYPQLHPVPTETQENQAYGANADLVVETNMAYGSQQDSKQENHYLQLLDSETTNTATQSYKANPELDGMEENDAYESTTLVDKNKRESYSEDIAAKLMPVETEKNVAYGSNELVECADDNSNDYYTPMH